MSSPDAVLDFWFGSPLSPDFGAVREMWFRKSAATDDEITRRFANDVHAALRGERDHWADTPRGALALVLVLDQFTRNIFRDTPASFSGDEKARAVARNLVAGGGYATLAPVEQWFAAMPFEHSESIDDQRESMRLFTALAERGQGEPLEWARKHYEVIERFGRFPHRNSILGRQSTADEAEHLRQFGGF